MKCPECGNTRTVTRQLDWNTLEANDVCMRCMHHWNVRKLIDPAELLRLVEKAEKRHKDNWATRPKDLSEECIGFFKGELSVMGIVKSYLTGNHESLEKLAGE